MHFNVDAYMGLFVLLENNVDNEKPYSVLVTFMKSLVVHG
jgi:hypothetical protein